MNQQSKVILVAQIGMGNYRTLAYGKMIRQNQEILLDASTLYRTGYSFEAVCNQLRRDLTLGDETQIEILLIGTETSLWGSLCAYYALKTEERASVEQQVRLQEMFEDADTAVQTELVYAQNGSELIGIGIRNIRECQETVGLFLSEHMGIPNVHISLLILEHGVIDEENSRNFSSLVKQIKQMIEEGDTDQIDICFDISMGYRSLPMYVFNVVNYLARLRPEEFRLHVYYGMEAGTVGKVVNEDRMPADVASMNRASYRPMLNLHQLEELTRWINVLSEFREYGSVRGLVRMLREVADQEERRIALHLAESLPEPELLARWQDIADARSYADLFSQFDYATNSNNLKMLEQTIQEIIGLKDLEDHILPAEAALLLKDIGREFEERFGTIPKDYPYGFLTIRLAQWFYDQGRISNAAVAVQEGMVTYLMERYPDCCWTESGNWKNHNEREKVKNLLIRIGAPHKKDAQSHMLGCFCRVKDQIRNVSSHILYSDVSIEEAEQDVGLLERLIDYMQWELLQETDGTENFADGLWKRRLPDYLMEVASKADFRYFMEYIRKSLEQLRNDLDEQKREVSFASIEASRRKRFEQLDGYIQLNGIRDKLLRLYRKQESGRGGAPVLSEKETVFLEKMMIQSGRTGRAADCYRTAYSNGSIRECVDILEELLLFFESRPQLFMPK